MKNVWEEMGNLRGLLETQLSSLAWNDASKKHPQKAKLLKHLLELGLTPELSYSLVEKTNPNESFESSCYAHSLTRSVARLWKRTLLKTVALSPWLGQLAWVRPQPLPKWQRVMRCPMAQIV